MVVQSSYGTVYEVTRNDVTLDAPSFVLSNFARFHQETDKHPLAFRPRSTGLRLPSTPSGPIYNNVALSLRPFELQ